MLSDILVWSSNRQSFDDGKLVDTLERKIESAAMRLAGSSPAQTGEQSNQNTCWRSSKVERGSCKAHVVGSSPIASSVFSNPVIEVKTIHRTYRFELKPTQNQKMLLNKHFGCVRFVYNHFLNERMEQ